METQIELARRGKITEEMKAVAEEEGVSVEALRRSVAAGRVVITRNLRRVDVRPLGIGEGLRIKVNANVGTSTALCDLELEVEKARTAVKYGADTIMDLSTAGDLDEIRRRIIAEVDVPVGTVPVYQAAIEAADREGSIVDMTEDDLFNTIEKHLKDGVDFITVHCGVTKRIVEHLKKNPRLMGMVSRGGTFHALWILHHDEENPLYANFDYLLEIAHEYDATLSLGDGLRPGCIYDSTDWPQIQELLTIGTLVKRAREAGVQSMVEGPGHLPLHHIETNVRLEKLICDNAPFYVLGPVVTDIAPGYDHIVSAIGGALAGMYGADFLCYVTPAEHLGLPLVDDVKRGVIAARIAAHAADIVRLGEKAMKWDFEMDVNRSKLDWDAQIKLALDPDTARTILGRAEAAEPCGMCGKFCALKLYGKYFKKAVKTLP